MSFRRLVLIAFWVTSLIAVDVWAQSTPHFVSPKGQNVLSGNDLGFRVERVNDQGATGTLVVRIDGKWVEAGFSPRVER